MKAHGLSEVHRQDDAQRGAGEHGVHRRGAKTTPAALRKAWSPRFTDALKHGRDALKLRKDALAAQAETEADITRAIERLDRARRAVDGALTSYAAEHDLPVDFNDRFFPATVSSSKKTAAPVDHGDPKPA